MRVAAAAAVAAAATLHRQPLRRQTLHTAAPLPDCRTPSLLTTKAVPDWKELMLEAAGTYSKGVVKTRGKEFKDDVEVISACGGFVVQMVNSVIHCLFFSRREGRQGRVVRVSCGLVVLNGMDGRFAPVARGCRARSLLEGAGFKHRFALCPRAYQRVRRMIPLR